MPKKKLPHVIEEDNAIKSYPVEWESLLTSAKKLLHSTETVKIEDGPVGIELEITADNLIGLCLSRGKMRIKNTRSPQMRTILDSINNDLFWWYEYRNCPQISKSKTAKKIKEFNSQLEYLSQKTEVPSEQLRARLFKEIQR